VVITANLAVECLVSRPVRATPKVAIIITTTTMMTTIMATATLPEGVVFGRVS
jgi:hypothetical protein